MHISRIQIENFRNFASLDVKLGEHAVIVGENKIGKSNLLHALRLVLDPSLPDTARNLRQEDFWDGLERPLGKDDRIIISAEISDFEENENQLAVLAEHLIGAEPMVAKLTYVWQAQAGVKGSPKKNADYEFLFYGGDRPENQVSYDLRRRLPMELMAALRDCEGDLGRWSRSPLRPLLDRAASDIDRDELERMAEEVDKANDSVAETDEVSTVADGINDKLVEMVGSSQALETALRLSPADPDRLIRALRVFIDGGKRGVADASLGSANVLYFALKTLEHEQLVEEGGREHTFLAIEEPEAHLHPNLQRLVFRNYLRKRDDEAEEAVSPTTTILMTTHSPHIASVTPLREFVLLRLDSDGDATEGVSTAEINLTPEETSDLERYIDVSRGEILFCRGVILVEGIAEKYLVPVLPAKQGHDLDELGIAVCSIEGTNFWPYLSLVGEGGLGIPFAALTDYDPTDGGPRGPGRVVDRMLQAVVDEETWDENEFEALLKLAPSYGIFMNDHTLEVDLFKAGLHKEIAKTMDELSTNESRKKRMRGWAKKPASMDAGTMLADIKRVGKGRFAQRLATILAKTETKACPEYISEGVKHVADTCRPSTTASL